MLTEVHTYKEARKRLREAGSTVKVSICCGDRWITGSKKEFLSIIKAFEINGQSHFENYNGEREPLSYDNKTKILYLDNNIL